MKQISVGDKFRLCGVEWEVRKIGGQCIVATWGTKNENPSLSFFPLSGADSLDWIEEELQEDYPSDVIRKNYYQKRGRGGDDPQLMFDSILDYLDEKWLNEHKKK